MLVKLAFSVTPMSYPDVDMLRGKDIGNLATEYVHPRRLKRNLPTLPEDNECGMEVKKFNKQMHKRRRQRRQCLRLPSLPEHDEC